MSLHPLMSLHSLTLPPAVFASPAASILLPIVSGTAVGYSTRPKETKTTYEKIRQPPGRPPAWVFGPAWTVLYGLMGYASHRATSIGLSSLSPRAHDLVHVSQTLYTTQLALNLAWMPLFFGMRRPVAALVDMVLLYGNVGLLTFYYAHIDRTSAWLMAPYMAWLTFASYLNVGVGILNNWDISEKEQLDKEE